MINAISAVLALALLAAAAAPLIVTIFLIGH